MTTGTIPVRPHTVSGSEHLNEAMVRAYLGAGGYEAETLIAEARRFPGTYGYTFDRHRYIAYIMPGGYWKAGDCTESGERIKALRAARRGGARRRSTALRRSRGVSTARAD